MLRSKNIKKREGGGWEIEGVPNQTFTSRDEARKYIRATNAVAQSRDVVDQDDNAFSGQPQDDFKEVDPFTKVESQWAKEVDGDQTVN